MRDSFCKLMSFPIKPTIKLLATEMTVLCTITALIFQ